MGRPGKQGGSLPEGAARNADEALEQILGPELANAPCAPMARDHLSKYVLVDIMLL